MSLLKLKNVTVEIEGKQVVSDLSLEIEKGKTVVVLGPNGAGKSSLCNVIMGSSRYPLTKGKIELEGVDISSLKPEERAQKGLFMAFQQPAIIQGVTMLNFLRTAYNAQKQTKLKSKEFADLLTEKMKELNLDASWRRREVHVGFSGGEKKRSELLQLLLFEPKVALLDEIDSGLDVDALKLVAKTIEKLKKKGTGFLIITHSDKLLNYIAVDSVAVLKDGALVEQGGKELIERIHTKGFTENG